MEFIAAITQHIPEKNFQLVRYYGWYSNRMGGDRFRSGIIQGQRFIVRHDITPGESFYSRDRHKQPSWKEVVGVIC